MSASREGAPATAPTPFKDRVRQFREGRQQFPEVELAKHRGQWVAFSGDGRRILASGATLAEMNQALVEAGHDRQGTWAEFVDVADVNLGAIEFFS